MSRLQPFTFRLVAEPVEEAEGVHILLATFYAESAEEARAMAREWAAAHRRELEAEDE